MLLATPAPCTSQSQERGFTLLEVLITVSILAAFVLASIVMLVHRSGDVESSRESVIAIMSLAKTTAAANANVLSATGSTIGVVYESDANQSELTIYHGRPFRGFAVLAPVENISPLVIRGRLALDASSRVREVQNFNNFAVFIGASGRTSFTVGYHVDDGGTIAEPECDDTQNIRMHLSVDSIDSKPIVISCATGEIMNANDSEK